ncbi:MAG: hypothetical protein JRH06_13050, partial [Deltaproteobacteria bacterium]|nr:hypothetical protein [Deltaproteobacteria bacterium]
MDRAVIKGMRILLFLAVTALMLFGAGASFALAQDNQIQSIELLPSSSDETAGSSFSLSVMYTVGNADNTLTGIGIRIHFDSSKLQFTGFSNPFSNDLTAADSIAQDDTQDYDNDVSTDKYVGIAWASLGGDWPNEALPLELVQVGFGVNSQATSGVTPVNVSFSSVAAGYTGDATNATVSVSGGITTGSITGMVSYPEYSTGTIYIGAYMTSPPSGSPVSGTL